MILPVAGWAASLPSEGYATKLEKPFYQLAFQMVIVMHYVFWLGRLVVGKNIGLWI